MKSYLHLIALVVILLACESSSKQKIRIPNYLKSFDVQVGGRDGFDGLILVRKVTAPGAQMLINSEGEIIQFFASDTALFRPFSPSAERFLSLHSDKMIVELSYEGDTLLRLDYGQGGFNRLAHHDVTYIGENIGVLTREKYVVPDSSRVTLGIDTVFTDGILILNRNGDKVWSWIVTDVQNPMLDPDIKNKQKDWGHANSLDVDSDGHYLVSWRDFNEVWKIHSETGEVIWKYGNNFLSDSSQFIYGQHSFHNTGVDEYLVFDNGHKKHRPFSRAVGFTYDSESGFTQTLSIELPDSLFTSKQGSVYKIDEDRFLFSSSMSSSLIITDEAGDIKWFAKGTEPYYRAYYLADLNE